MDLGGGGGRDREGSRRRGREGRKRITTHVSKISFGKLEFEKSNDECLRKLTLPTLYVYITSVIKVLGKKLHPMLKNLNFYNVMYNKLKCPALPMEFK